MMLFIKGEKSYYLVNSTAPFLIIIFGWFCFQLLISNNIIIKSLGILLLTIFFVTNINNFFQRIDYQTKRLEKPFGLTLASKNKIADFIIIDSKYMPFDYFEFPISYYNHYSFDYLFLIKKKLPWTLFSYDNYNFMNYEFLMKINKSYLIKKPRIYNQYLILSKSEINNNADLSYIENKITNNKFKYLITIGGSNIYVIRGKE